MAFFNAFPAVKPGVFRAGILIGFPVCGFLPVRALRDLTMNVQKPVTTTLSPFFKASVIALKTAPTDSRAAFAVKLAFFATTSTRSAFVIWVNSPPFLARHRCRLRRQQAGGQKVKTRYFFVHSAVTGYLTQSIEFGLFCQDIILCIASYQSK